MLVVGVEPRFSRRPPALPWVWKNIAAASAALDAVGRTLGRVEYLVFLDVQRVDVTVAEVLVVHERLMERDRGADPDDEILAERSLHPPNALLTRFTPGDQLADQRVVVRAHADSTRQHRIEPHAWSVRLAIPGDWTDGWREVEERVLGGDSAFHGPAADRPLCSGVTQRQATGDPELVLYEVDPPHQFGDRMLNLKAGVHLKKGEALSAGSVGIVPDQKLDGAGRGVVAGTCRIGRGFFHSRPQLRRHSGSRRFLDQLLASTLSRTVALAQADDVAAGVGDHLDFDVACRSQQLFHEDSAIAERSDRFFLRLLHCALDLVCRFDDSDPSTAAACRRFDHNWIADLIGGLSSFVRVGERIDGAGDNRDAGLFHRAARLDFVAHQLDGFRRRADENDAVLAAGAGEVGVLRQEAVAGVDGVRTCLLRCRQHCIDGEIALRRGRAADSHCFIGHPHMSCGPIGVGENGDRLDAQVLRSSNHANCNLAAVGDQQFVERAQGIGHPLLSGPVVSRQICE